MKLLTIYDAPYDELSGATDQFTNLISNWWYSITNNLGLYAFNMVQIILVILVCKIILIVSGKITSRVMQKQDATKDQPKAKRTNTLMTLTRSVIRYATFFIGFAVILDILGFGNILSGLILTAGVGTLAISLGAQSLVRDVVTGLLLMFENQFCVGDFVIIDNFSGYVEATAMRVTYLRNKDGNQVIIPNGTISRVINVSRGDTVARVIISTRYQDNTQEVIKIIEEAANKYGKENKKLLKDKPKVQALADLGANSADIRIICKTESMKHWEVERGLRLAVKIAFDEHGIKYPSQTIRIESDNPGN